MKKLIMLIVFVAVATSFASTIVLDEVLIKPIKPSVEETIASLFPSAMQEYEDELSVELAVLSVEETIDELFPSVVVAELEEAEIPQASVEADPATISGSVVAKAAQDESISTSPKTASDDNALLKAKSVLAAGIHTLNLLQANTGLVHAWDSPSPDVALGAPNGN